MLLSYSFKAFSEQLHVIKVDDDSINPMYKFAGTITYISLKQSPHMGLSSLFLGFYIVKL